MADWFQQNAPTSASANPPPPSGDWFSDNSPDQVPGMEKLGALPNAQAAPAPTLPPKLATAQPPPNFQQPSVMSRAVANLGDSAKNLYSMTPSGDRPPGQWKGPQPKPKPGGWTSAMGRILHGESTTEPSEGHFVADPIMGPGDIAGAVGHAVMNPVATGKEMFAQDPLGTAATVGGTAKGLYSGAKALPNLTKVDPHIAVNRALRPTPSDPGFTERIPETIAAVKAANPGFEPAVVNGKLNLVPALNKTIRAHQEALEPWLQRAEGQMVPGNDIIDATAHAVSKMLPSERGAGAALIRRAVEDYGRGFTPRALRDRLALLNQRLDPFFNGSPSKQSSALADIPDAVLKAQRDSVAETLYRFLDPENEGAGPRLIQSKTGDLIDLRDAALRRQNAIVAEQPMTPLGELVDPVKGMIRSILPGKATGAGIAYAEGSEGRSLPLLRRAFAAVDENAGVNDFGSLPRPGPRSIAAPPDTSGPVNPAARDFSSVGSPFDTSRIQKLLPAAKSQIGVSGTTVPDIVGRSARGKGGPQGLLPAPQPGQPPINVLPRGPGAIGPAGTTPLRSTETPIPAGGERGGRMADILRDEDKRALHTGSVRVFPQQHIQSFIQENARHGLTLTAQQAIEKLQAEGWTIQ